MRSMNLTPMSTWASLRARHSLPKSLSESPDNSMMTASCSQHQVPQQNSLLLVYECICKRGNPQVCLLL